MFELVALLVPAALMEDTLTSNVFPQILLWKEKLWFVQTLVIDTTPPNIVLLTLYPVMGQDWLVGAVHLATTSLQIWVKFNEVTGSGGSRMQYTHVQIKSNYKLTREVTTVHCISVHVSYWQQRSEGFKQLRALHVSLICNKYPFCLSVTLPEQVVYKCIYAYLVIYYSMFLLSR